MGKIQKMKILDRKDVPKQGPNDDCSVFVQKFIEYVIQGRPISHNDQNNMKVHSKEICYSFLEFCEGNR